jgi:hypothetical protein
VDEDVLSLSLHHRRHLVPGSQALRCAPLQPTRPPEKVVLALLPPLPSSSTKNTINPVIKIAFVIFIMRISCGSTHAFHVMPHSFAELQYAPVLQLQLPPGYIEVLTPSETLWLGYMR